MAASSPLLGLNLAVGGEGESEALPSRWGRRRTSSQRQPNGSMAWGSASDDDENVVVRPASAGAMTPVSALGTGGVPTKASPAHHRAHSGDPTSLRWLLTYIVDKFSPSATVPSNTSLPENDRMPTSTLSTLASISSTNGVSASESETPWVYSDTGMEESDGGGGGSMTYSVGKPAALYSMHPSRNAVAGDRGRGEGIPGGGGGEKMRVLIPSGTGATSAGGIATPVGGVSGSPLIPSPSNREEPAKRWQNWWLRTRWTLILVLGFFAVVAAGHAWLVVGVVLIQLAVFKEVIQIAHVPSKEKKLPWFRVLNWYFLAATNYYLYGESVLQHYASRIPRFLFPLATHHRFLSFFLYCLGLVLFVLNLKRGHYKFQFAQFAWTHMALLLVVVQSHAVLNNILEGLIWLLLPSSLVIVNDVFAYICGFFWGKTPLIKISPKKTWEGFIGGAMCTLVFGFVFTYLLIKVPYFICPGDLGTSFWTSTPCVPNPVFIPQVYRIPPLLPSLNNATVRIAPVQLHALVFAIFASSIAPFGGFFASGIKRAFKIKDFGDTIPGHGGITDRFDCQFLMGTFSFIYLTSFIGRMGAGDVIQRAMQLSTEEQLAVYYQLQALLKESGALL